MTLTARWMSGMPSTFGRIAAGVGLEGGNVGLQCADAGADRRQLFAEHFKGQVGHTGHITRQVLLANGSDAIGL